MSVYLLTFICMLTSVLDLLNWIT